MIQRNGDARSESANGMTSGDGVGGAGGVVVLVVVVVMRVIDELARSRASVAIAARPRRHGVVNALTDTPGCVRSAPLTVITMSYSCLC